MAEQIGEHIQIGTDGWRGHCGPGIQYVNEELAVRVGFVAAEKLASVGSHVFVGQDTRYSSAPLSEAAAQGVIMAGISAIRVGVVPSPALGYLVREHAAAGIMVTASHNEKIDDNGIKLFADDGSKLPEGVEASIARRVAELRPEDLSNNNTRNWGVRTMAFGALTPEYTNFLTASAGTEAETAFKGLRLVMDCANGAASHIAPRLFTRLGAKVFASHHNPNGYNINQQCGAESTAGLAAVAEAVRDRKAHAGVVYDGDADRLVLVDETGARLNGDDIVFMLAHDPQHTRNLQQDGAPGAVTTIMSNIGLRPALRGVNGGVELYEAGVGDRQVLTEMRKHGLTLGGETSGHIFTRHLATGDGMLTAIQVLRQSREAGKPLSSWRKELGEFRVEEASTKLKVADSSVVRRESVREYVDIINETFGDKGRLIVRPSGTESGLIRVNMQRDGAAKLLPGVLDTLTELFA